MSAMGMAVRAVLFDLGGTLWAPFGDRPEDAVTAEAAAAVADEALPDALPDQKRLLASALVSRFTFMKAARRVAVQFSFADPVFREEDMVRIVADAMAAPGPGASLAPEAVEGLAEKFGRDLTRHFRLYEDTLPALGELRTMPQRPVLGIVSNTTIQPHIIDFYLEQCGLARLMGFRILSSETGWRKPHPAIYAAALVKAGVKPDEVLFVGDRLVEDVAGPSRLGMKTALCRASSDRPPAAAGVTPDIEVADLWGVVTALR